ncbi:TIGR03086 family metal-binding protein [Streptomyces sp. NPDC050732]|uniref:TIGR03086 family metal-binding protein n=1 Tax=Streptomyces sp. NPDC050732 TaxID=3154632 RepID=UPI003432B4AE
MPSAPIDDLATVLDAVGDLIADVPRDRWNAPTPCPQWNVRELVNHMVIGNRLFADILHGQASATPGALDPKTSDALGSDPLDAHRSSADAMVAAFRQPGALEQIFRVPAGTVPGIAALHLRTTEALVHGWDLAQATDQQPRFPNTIVERELASTRSKLADVPPERTPFGSPQPAPHDAPPLTRLAALLGRRISPPGDQ